MFLPGIANLKEWRSRVQHGESFTTPSGLNVRLRRISLLALVERGGVPTPLLGTVQQLTNSPNGQIAFKLSDFPQFAEVASLVSEEAIIEPRVMKQAAADELLSAHGVTAEVLDELAASEETPPEHLKEAVERWAATLRVSDLPIEDRMAIFTWANQRALALEPFRPE